MTSAVEIKGWFMSKNFSDRERLAIIGVTPEILGETEKAVKFLWATDCGKIFRWVPKSCLVTEEDKKSENTPEKIAARVNAMQARENAYQDLINKCRANGIPARKGWRVATMKAKLAEVSA